MGLNDLKLSSNYFSDADLTLISLEDQMLTHLLVPKTLPAKPSSSHLQNYFCQIWNWSHHFPGSHSPMLPLFYKSWQTNVTSIGLWPISFRLFSRQILSQQSPTPLSPNPHELHFLFSFFLFFFLIIFYSARSFRTLSLGGNISSNPERTTPRREGGGGLGCMRALQWRTGSRDKRLLLIKENEIS